MPHATTGLAAHYEERTATYARFGNGVVADAARALLPPGGRVLDIGCASGGLLELLRHQASYSAGIELSGEAARAAAAVADRIVHGDAAAAVEVFERGSFDLVVLADVLEHLPVAEELLAQAVDWTRPGGAVLVSVPNIAHWQARLTLLRGRWPQEDSGTFDSGHLGFFTKQRLQSMLEACELREVQVTPVVPRLRNHLPWLGRLRGAARWAEDGWQGLGKRRPELLGYQLVASGRRG